MDYTHASIAPTAPKPGIAAVVTALTVSGAALSVPQVMIYTMVVVSV